MDRFLADERRYVSEDIDYVEQHSPFKSSVNLKEIRDLEIDVG